MCELGVFPIFFFFLENDFSKVDKILALAFFKARKEFEGLKMLFFHLPYLYCLLDAMFTLNSRLFA